MLHSQFLQEYEAKEKEVKAAYECNHVGLVENRQQLHSNGLIHIAQQCIRCGKLIQYIPQNRFSEREIAALPQYDQEARGRYTQERADLLRRWREYYEKQQQRATGRAPIYEAYLQSPEWKQKRALVMKRANGICEGCGLNRATEVHHLTYDHAGNEFLWELRAVCGECHERIHGISQKGDVA